MECWFGGGGDGEGGGEEDVEEVADGWWSVEELVVRDGVGVGMCSLWWVLESVDNSVFTVWSLVILREGVVEDICFDKWGFEFVVFVCCTSGGLGEGIIVIGGDE